jgi:hypothetical protein
VACLTELHCSFVLVLYCRVMKMCVCSGGDWTASCTSGFTPRKEPLVSAGEETVSPKANLAAGCDRDVPDFKPWHSIP